jgi:hypothetical protein
MKTENKQEKQILEEARQGLHKAMGMTSREFEKHVSYPHNRKIVINKDEMHKYLIVAEVIKSKYCGAGLLKGEKLVFRAMPALFMPEQSDCPLCLRAVGPLANLVAGFWDRMIDHRNPNEGMWYLSECLDPGLDKGGFGHVVFKVYAVKE